MDKKDFAFRLAELRTKKNISAREMSMAIGQNPGYINHIETGQGTPSLSVMFFICEYLGVTPSEFFDIHSPNPTKLKKINEYLKQLDDELLDAVEKIVKGLVNNK